MKVLRDAVTPVAPVCRAAGAGSPVFGGLSAFGLAGASLELGACGGHDQLPGIAGPWQTLRRCGGAPGPSVNRRRLTHVLLCTATTTAATVAPVDPQPCS